MRTITIRRTAIRLLTSTWYPLRASRSEPYGGPRRAERARQTLPSSQGLVSTTPGRRQRALGCVTAFGVILVLAAPAAAQDPDWLRALERGVEAQAHALARVFALDEAQRGLRGRGADDPRFGPEVTERVSRTVRLDRTGTLDLSNIVGAIVVTGVGGDEVRIEAVKRTRNPNEASARADLEAVQIEVRELGNRVDVRTEYPRGRRNLVVAVEFTVSVPQDASVGVRTVSGDVRVTNVRGELRVDATSGSVQVSSARRLVAVKSVSGDVQVTDAQADGTVSVTTVSGHQVIRGLKARGVESQSVSGGLTLTDMDCERTDLRTISGNITYSGPLARAGRYEAQTHSGNISLAVAAGGFDVEASTFSGDFRSDYALTLGGGQVETGGRGRRPGPSNRAIRGRFGDGGALLSLRSFSGNIAITRR
ncbi:MAG: DUF4097 family beta strand repeat protein [Acidobacteria bacterium]|nr:DUF4097 family beta strand repeat protein [Acidobacteriota bacterium]